MEFVRSVKDGKLFLVDKNNDSKTSLSFYLKKIWHKEVQDENTEYDGWNAHKEAGSSGDF